MALKIGCRDCGNTDDHETWCIETKYAEAVAERDRFKDVLVAIKNLTTGVGVKSALALHAIIAAIKDLATKTMGDEE